MVNDARVPDPSGLLLELRVGPVDIISFLVMVATEGASIILVISTAAAIVVDSAALETVHYGFVTLLQPQGNLIVLDGVLLVRRWDKSNSLLSRLLVVTISPTLLIGRGREARQAIAF